jgi:hypothetical protein
LAFFYGYIGLLANRKSEWVQRTIIFVVKSKIKHVKVQRTAT